jgi:glutathione S-transferase
MSLTLYHCRDARSTRPLWALEELRLDYELINMEFPPRFKYEGYLKINPLGTVPTFIDGSLTMTESCAIVQYLVDKYGGGSSLGISVDEAEYGDYLNWLQLSDATLTFPQTLILRYAKFEKPERRQPQIVEDYTQWYFSRLRCVESALQDHDYLCADRFTIADICVGYALYLTKTLKLDGNFRPKTKAYLKRLMARPGFESFQQKQAALAPCY